MSLDPKKTVCIERWRYPNVGLNRSLFRMCCKTPPRSTDLKDESDSNFFMNTEYERQRRLEMLQGVRHSDCNQCWMMEDNGVTSLRQYMNSEQAFVEKYKSELIEEFGTTDLLEISKLVNENSKILNSNSPSNMEVTLDSTCDLKCVYCNHDYSTQWAASNLKNKMITLQKYKQLSSTIDDNSEFVKDFWKWLDTSAKYHLKNISIIGGEPTIMPYFYNFCNKLLEVYSTEPNQKVTLIIVTNLNTPSTYFKKFINFIEKLSDKFIVKLHVSMEATEYHAEFIREKLSWARFEQNINYILSLQKIEVRMIPTINALSVPYLDRYLKWILDLDLKYGTDINLLCMQVNYPKYLSPTILPKEYKPFIDRAIETLGSSKPYYSKFLLGIKESFKEFESIDQQLLKQFYVFSEKKDLLKTFPEFSVLVDRIKSQIYKGMLPADL